MKKRALKSLCVIVSFVMIILSVIFLAKDKHTYQKLDATQPNEETFDTTKDAVESPTQEELSTDEITDLEETITSNTENTTEADSLKSLVSATSSKYNAVSTQVATIVDGKVYATTEYGWASKNDRAMTSETKIRVASISKTILSFVVFRLIEENLLDLDTDISEYLDVSVKNPSYPDTPITLRTLLAHSSSLVDASYTYSLDQLRNHLQEPSAYTKYKPGTHYSYNNFAFGVVGTLCEVVTGKSVTTLLNEYFFVPMGIKASFIPEMLDPNEIAVLYSSNHKVFRSVKTQLNQLRFTDEAGAGLKLYAGGLTISAKDFAKLLTLLMNDGMYDGVRFLSTESIELIHSVQSKRDGGKIGQGMPVMIRYKLYGDRQMVYHTGNAYGVRSLYTYDRTTKSGVVIVTVGASEERDSYGIYSVCSEIATGVMINGINE